MPSDHLDLTDTPVLLTGGSGFVGSYLAAGLAAAGARVFALVRRPGDHPGLASPNITQIAGDFADPATARRACAGMELVVHCAATIGAAGEVAVTGDGLPPLPWTHIANVRHAAELALAAPVSRGRAYNVVDGHVTWRRYVEDVQSWFADAPAAPDPGEPGRPEEPAFVGRCSNERIRSELGYEPLRTYEQGMAEAAAWWRQRRA